MKQEKMWIMSKYKMSDQTMKKRCEWNQIKKMFEQLNDQQM